MRASNSSKLKRVTPWVPACTTRDKYSWVKARICLQPTCGTCLLCQRSRRLPRLGPEIFVRLRGSCACYHFQALFFESGLSKAALNLAPPRIRHRLRPRQRTRPSKVFSPHLKKTSSKRLHAAYTTQVSRRDRTVCRYFAW